MCHRFVSKYPISLSGHAMYVSDPQYLIKMQVGVWGFWVLPLSKKDDDGGKKEAYILYTFLNKRRVPKPKALTRNSMRGYTFTYSLPGLEDSEIT